jgi:hypothetical protein
MFKYVFDLQETNRKYSIKPSFLSQRSAQTMQYRQRYDNGKKSSRCAHSSSNRRSNISMCTPILSHVFGVGSAPYSLERSALDKRKEEEDEHACRY